MVALSCSGHSVRLSLFPARQRYPTLLCLSLRVGDRKEQEMQIVDVKTHVMGTAWRNLTFVRVLTEEGLEGIGEVRMLNHTDALLGYFAKAVPNHVVGSDPFNIEDL